MKFLKDGLYFSDIIQARDFICGYRDEDGKPYCSICPAFYPEHCNLAQYYKQNHLNVDNCYDFCVNNPRVAAEIMGFEVIEDGATPKSQNPFADIGSMTLAQAKEYCRNYRQNCIGHCEEVGTCELRNRHICGDWTHEWETVRDRLTPEELEICKSVGAKWISKDGHKSCSIQFWKEKPTKGDDGLYCGIRLGFLPNHCFPSVKPYDCICVDDLIKEATNGT